MANFAQTRPLEFNPYIPEIPVDATVKVGMFKQQQYQQGLERVHNYFDTISGLPVDAKFSPYVQDKLKNLKNQISTSLSGDFSDQQLVSHIGRMASEITKDPVVKNAILSTQNMQSAEAELKKARETGKGYSPSNEWLLQKQISNWRNNPDLNTPFSGGYTPFSDYNKHVLDALKQLNPSITENPFKGYDSNGNLIIDEAMIKQSGLSYNTVRSAIAGALTEGDKRQLQIDGLYAYKDYTPEDLKNSIEPQYKSIIRDKEKQLSDLINVNQKTNSDDIDYQRKVQADIDALKQDISTSKANYASLTNQIASNPEAFKAQYYTTQYLNNMVKAYSNTNTEYVTNPFETVKLKEQQNAIALKRLELSQAKADAKAKKQSGNISDLILPGGIAGNVPETKSGEDLIKLNQDNIDSLKSVVDTRIQNFISAHPEYTPAQVKDLVANYNGGSNLSPEIDYDIRAISQANKEYTNQLDLTNTINQKAEDIYNPKIQQSLKEIGNITVNNTTFTPEDILAYKKHTTEYSAKLPIGVPLQTLGVDYLQKHQFQPANPKEALLNQYIHSSEGKELRKAAEKITNSQINILKEKTDYIGNQLADRLRIGQNTTFGINTSTAKDRSRVFTMINNKLIATEGQEDLQDSEDKNRPFDREKMNEMITGPSSGNTAVNLTKDGGTGQNYIVLSNSKVAKGSLYLPISEQDSENLGLNATHEKSIADDIVSTIDMGGKFSTNWSADQNPLQAKFGRESFPLLQNNGRFSVTADIKKSTSGDVYGLYYHIYDNKNPKRGWITKPLSVGFNKNQLSTVSNILNRTSVDQILQLLGEGTQ